VLQAAGMTVVNWNRDTKDATTSPDNVPDLVSQWVSGPKTPQISLQHDRLEAATRQGIHSD
jgi:hypothetical protein